MIIVIVNKAQFDYFFEVFSKLIQNNCIKVALIRQQKRLQA